MFREFGVIAAPVGDISRGSVPDRTRVFTISLSEVFDTRLRQK